MGDEHAPKIHRHAQQQNSDPGRTNAHGGQINDPVVGKTTQVEAMRPRFPESWTAGLQSTDYKAFEHWGDGPAGGDAKKASHNTKGSFLNGEQRERLELLFVARALAAQDAYTGTLADMHAENLVKKPEEQSIWAKLFETVVGEVAEFAIMKALVDLHKVGVAVEKLKDAKILEVKGSEVEGKLFGLNEKTVESAVGLGVDKSKEKVVEKKIEAQNEAGQEEQDAKDSYIGYLQDNSMMLFQHIREDKLAKMTDSELLAMTVAYEGWRHTRSVYRAKLKTHIDLFMNSHAKDIGHKTEDGLKDDKKVHLRKETRVAWVINGRAGKQLVYMAKEFVVSAAHSPGPAYDAPDNALGAEETGTWNNHNLSGEGFLGRNAKNSDTTEQTHAKEAEPEFLGPVEQELQQAALAAHEKRWLQAPETLMKGPYGWIVVPQ